MGVDALLFPERCLVCDRQTRVVARDLCARCAPSAIPIDDRACPGCALPGFDDSICVGCRLEPNSFDALGAAFEFGGAVAEATRRAKYGRDLVAWRSVVSWAEPILVPLLRARLTEGFVVTWVPMASRSARRRGFDPPAIALHWMSIPHCQLVRRRRDRRRQATVGAEDREANARAAFEVRPDMPIPPRICLFDDVVTTGATMNAIAEKLRSAGAEEVVGIALARTPR